MSLDDRLNFLIILVSFQRPRMVINALESIKNVDYPEDKVFISFIDDGSVPPTAPLAEPYMGSWKSGEWVHSQKYEVATHERGSIYTVYDSVEDKEAQGGTRHPELMNKSILDSPLRPEDVVMVVCDDDGVFPSALKKLDEYYREHPEVMYSYGHVAIYNPMTERPSPEHAGRSHWTNHTEERIWPYCRVDGSQVTYRKQAFLDGIRYPSPIGRAADASLFSLLQDKYGQCPFNNTTIQHKGWFDNQLGNRHGEAIWAPEDSNL